MKLGSTYEDYLEYGDRYKFYCNKEEKTIICAVLYKGKTIRGIAKCDPEDEFNLELGKKLAYLRCRKKFLRKKLKRALQVERDAIIAEARAKCNLANARDFVSDSEIQFNNTINELAKFEAELNNQGE